MEDIRSTIKEYLLEEFLPGEDPSALTDATPLVTGGILDSIRILKMVAFLEEEFGIEIEAPELTAEALETLAQITALVQDKVAPQDPGA